jgi:ADP-heptose:LPS heptosyltransferase
MLYILLTWLLAPLWWPVALVRRIATPTPKRILIAEIAGIGDVVCSASLFQSFRDQYPEATIDLLVDPIAKGLAPLLPMVNRVRLFAYPEQKGLKGRLKLARIAVSYDIAICLIPSAAQLTAFCWGSVSRRFTVLPCNVNTSYRLLAPLMTRVVCHAICNYFPATQFELCKTLLPDRSMPQKALTIYEQEVPSLPADRDWVGFLVSSGRALKRLSESQMVAVMEELLKNTEQKWGILLFGGPGDIRQAEKILERLAHAGVSENIVNTVGQYELAKLPGLLRQLKLFVGVDSGVTHMADAFNVPIVCIAGPVNLHEVYLPGENKILLESELDCHPCSTVFSTPNSCAREDRACLEQLNPKQIVTSVEMLLEKGTKRHAQ